MKRLKLFILCLHFFHFPIVYMPTRMVTELKIPQFQDLCPMPIQKSL